MGQSYRIRTELGITKTINVELTQEFEFLEILSLKLQQQDVYSRLCADYGVMVGRVTANNGLGIPNARIGVFIPIEQVDQSNPLISSIYPYDSPTDRNEDGFRYNLLPYEPSYTGHASTGTLPTRLDVLTGNTTVEIYDKYYKFTAKTNESGDYMIMGVPLGEQTVVMDVDLSDIGEFSLTPQDLIRMGLATEAQVAGNRFRASEDLNSLPQIINLTKVVEISPLWGEPSVCQIAINRVDFDLRNEANVDIQPTAVFMGSIYSTADQFRIRQGARPKDNFGNLCGLTTGPGQIIALRQTVQVDLSGNPILEKYEIEKNGNVIDGDGTWLLELPMNLNYIVTNEFGEKILSNDPTIGIPTKAKYRFKIKWEQSPSLTQQVRRAYYLVPNVREFGWSVPSFDPNFSNTTNLELKSSYYFGLDWSGYTEGLSATQASQKIDEIINCEDTFYEFDYNRVYTVSGLIDQYKNGGRARFIGIKEIDSQDCDDTINKFPVNEGFKNFDFLFFIVSILLQVLQLLAVPLIVVASIFAWFWNNVLVPLKEFFTALFAGFAAFHLYRGIRYSILAGQSAGKAAAAAVQCAAGILTECPKVETFLAESKLYKSKAKDNFQQARDWGIALISFELIMRLVKRERFPPIKLPSITYPTCISCDCGGYDLDSNNSTNTYSILSKFSNPNAYVDKLQSTPLLNSYNSDDRQILANAIAQVIGTNADFDDVTRYKTMYVDDVVLTNGDQYFAYSDDLPLSERINLFNQRKKYFDGVNRISVTFDSDANSGIQHFDNTLTFLMDSQIPSGTLMTFVNPSTTNDINFLFEDPNSSYPNGISGFTPNIGQSTYNVSYAINQQQNDSKSYILTTGSSLSNYGYPADTEYYQVLTAITVSQATQLWSTSNPESLPAILNSTMVVKWNVKPRGLFTSWGRINTYSPIKFADLFENFSNQYIVILQRGVDPYSPIFKNKYGIGKILGLPNENDFIIEANARVNIPIQKLNSPTISVQQFNQQTNLFYQSHFFEPGTQFVQYSTKNVGYYGKYDASSLAPFSNAQPINGGVTGQISNLGNGAYDSLNTNPTGRYNAAEDVSSEGFYYVNDGNKPDNTDVFYYTQVLKSTVEANPILMSNKNLNVMRTDRLPSSDGLDGESWDTNPSTGQQNLGFTIYQYATIGQTIQVAGVGSGADVIPPDIDGQIAETNIFNSFECSNLVPFSCYSNQGTNFTINPNCDEKDIIQNGCYVILKRPLVELSKDIRAFQEWAYRFRFFYGLCRGVLSQSFTNNWVNGSLFTFPIQVDTTYDRFNRPKYPKFEKKLIYFDESTNNFYYRSSPFIRNYSPSEFVGRPTVTDVQSLNQRNLMFPTTIINLGMKDSFFGEIILEPSTNAYIMRNLNPSSYNDTSDLVNLFVISRIADTTFLSRMNTYSRDNAINQFFTRNGTSVLTGPRSRLDADLAQLFSINSEFGLIGFTPEYYPISSTGINPVVLLYQGATNPVIGVFYSSTTENLQDKDYLTPGIINFRTNPNAPAITYPYGIKSQKVPFYQWQLNQAPLQQSIFGNVTNNWATNLSDIVTSNYQSLNRRNLVTPNYFVPGNTTNDIYQRGYIFSVDASGNYDLSISSNFTNKFLIGAPNQFYFGIMKGNSALDKFKTKYLPNE